jgi:pyruvate formate lyase activating enzyme
MAISAEKLHKFTIPGDLFEKMDNQRVRCLSCGHRCSIPNGESGICKMHINRGGELCVPFGYVSGAQADPVEKKPFFHVLPGAYAYSYGMLGCNLQCGYCQNWITSQTFRESQALSHAVLASPKELVSQALAQHAEIMISTYNEPLISNEWSVAVFKEAKAAGLLTGYVSNGYASPESLLYLKPWLDLCKVDLKTFDDHRYQELGGRLQPVLDTIRTLHEMGKWVEIVTLLVPGFNDSPKELTLMTEFLAGISVDIPWHVTAFHQDYKMMQASNTTPFDLLKAVNIGKKSGLNYVYAGNLPGQLQNWENTYCSQCRALLIERNGFSIRQNTLKKNGLCPSCNLSIPGMWSTKN